MATPFISYHKLHVTHNRLLNLQTAHHITCLNLAKKSTKRAQFIRFHTIHSLRHSLAHYINCVDYHLSKLDILSRC